MPRVLDEAAELLGRQAPDFGFDGVALGSAVKEGVGLMVLRARPTPAWLVPLALGVAAHLAWDAFRGWAPFPWVLPAHGVPWLWVNAAVGVGVALATKFGRREPWFLEFRAAEA